MITITNETETKLNKLFLSVNHDSFKYSKKLVNREKFKGFKTDTCSLKMFEKLTKILIRNGDFNISSSGSSFSKNSIIAVSYSGGRDSTYLIEQNLEKGYYVIPIYNRLNPQITENAIMNDFIMTWNLVELSKKYPRKIIIDFIHMDDEYYNTSLYISTYGNIFLSQQPFNAYSFAYGIPENLYPCIKECQMAFIMGDHALSFLQEINNVYKSSMKFTHGYRTTKHIPPLKFPLIQINKSEIEELFFHNRNLIGNTCQDLNVYRGSYNKTKKEIKLYFSECGTCNTCHHRMLEKCFDKKFESELMNIISFNFKDAIKKIETCNPTMACTYTKFEN